MFFFNKLATSSVSFIIHEFIDDDGEASIRFMSGQDTLLALDMLTRQGLIIVNQNIEGKNLSSPPYYKTRIDYLTNILFNYHETKNTLTIEFIHQFHPSYNFKRRLLVKNFVHDKIITIGIRLSLNSNNHNNNSDYDNFLKDCIRLDSFKKIEGKLKGTVAKAKLVNNLLDSSSNYKKIEEKSLKGIGTNMDKILDMELRAVESDTENENVNINDSNTIDHITLFPENQESHEIVLYKNGKLGHGDDIGKWIFHNKRLLLFLGGKSIYLIENNGLISSIDGLKWFSQCQTTSKSHHNRGSITNFLNKYGQIEKWIILVITCYKRFDLAKQVSHSWLKDFRKMGIMCLFVVGDTDRVKEMGGEFIDRDILYLNCSDSYEALPSKVVHACNYCYNNFKFNYLYKIDDDTVVNPLKLLGLDLKGKDYIGRPQQVTREFNRFWHRNKCQNKVMDNIPYPAQRIILGAIYAKGEAGYFLSKRAVSYLVQDMDYIKSDLYEDKAIGEALRKVGIKLYSCPEYQTKLSENFNKDRRLDKYCVIMDVGRNINTLYHNHFEDKIN